jgi:hypothetical protein
MKQVFITTVILLMILSAYSYAQMHEGMMGSDMMGSQSEQQTGGPSYSGGYPPCPHMMGQGGCGMMGQHGMMHGMMGQGGCGMMGQHGMMHGMMGQGGCGMMGQHGMMHGMMGQGGCGMMGQHGMMGSGMGSGMMWGYDAKTYQKHLDDTVNLRKDLHNKKFEYSEALRKPDTKRETILNIQKEMQELQKKIYEKTPK